MIIHQVSTLEWKDGIMKDMYENVFGEYRQENLEKCDFVLICRDDDLEAVGFITCHEMDGETLYWQHGGAAKKIKNSIHVSSHYVHFIKWSIERYKRITTRIENTNTAMLRLALKCGFLIYGIWNFKNKIYLELCYEPEGV